MFNAIHQPERGPKGYDALETATYMVLGRPLAIQRLKKSCNSLFCFNALAEWQGLLQSKSIDWVV